MVNLLQKKWSESRGGKTPTGKKKVVNKSHLGFKLRRIQRWFHSQASDKEAIKAKTKPKWKITSSGKKSKKPRLQIPKKSARQRRAQEPPGPPSGPPPK